MRKLFYSFLFISGLIFTISCERSTFVGSDLFTPESIELFFEEDFEIRAKTIPIDSAITYDLANGINSSLVGILDDPVFGRTIAESYIDMHISTNEIPEFQYLEDGIVKFAELDSAVLILALEEDGFYGDSLSNHEVQVDLLANELTFKDTIYTTFQPEPLLLLSRANYVPNLKDTTLVIEAGDSLETAYVDMARFTMDFNFFNELIQDTSLINSDQVFTNYAPGLRISSVPNGSSLWAIDFERTAEYPFNSILMYYKRGEEQRSYRIFVDGDRHMYVKHDYSGSLIESFFNDEEKGDSLLFLQGMAGAEIELDIPVLADPSYSEFLINKAELEFFVLEDESNELYPPIERIILERYNENGDIIETEDVFLAFQVLSEGSFDGRLTETEINGTTIRKYTAAMSVHALRMFSSDNPDTRIRIRADNKIVRPNRSIIFGPGHSTYPMKFKLTYSK